jgi:murein DD-endopeptidase MepM/ murein hydrolase activator NlpD
MKIVEHLRLDAARLTGVGLVAGLATVSAIDVAQAGAPALPQQTAYAAAPTPLARNLFAPVSRVGAPPLLAGAVGQTPAQMPAQPASFTTGAPAGFKAAFVFGFPLPGHEVNSRFGFRQLSDESRARIHEGVDIAAPFGSQIHAAASGRVSRTGDSPSYGHFVEVAHADGLTSFYAHMSRTAGLRPGAAVTQGEVLGYVGTTGHSTGPHLHFEIRKDGQPLDPQAFMGHQFASAADLPLAQARAPGLLTRVKQHLRMLASNWHVRGHGGFRLASYRHRSHYARG